LWRRNAAVTPDAGTHFSTSRALMGEQTTRILTNETSELQRMVAFILPLGVRKATPADIKCDRILALDTMMTNVVEHAELGDREQQMTVPLSVNEDEFAGPIEDEGRGRWVF
jgi:hypothetical protein